MQTDDGDIAVKNGRLTLTIGLQEKAQKIRNRLGLVKGEWFLDKRQGTPWWERILGTKNPDMALVRRVLTTVILSVPGIVDVEELTATFHHGTRRLTYDFVAIDDEGQRIEGGSSEFIVDP